MSEGFFLETYHQKSYAALGILDKFVQDNHSCSAKGTLRGLHYQLPHAQAKLCRLVEGEALDVAVDIRLGSPPLWEVGPPCGFRPTGRTKSISRLVSRTGLWLSPTGCSSSTSAVIFTTRARSTASSGMTRTWPSRGEFQSFHFRDEIPNTPPWPLSRRTSLPRYNKK